MAGNECYTLPDAMASRLKQTAFRVEPEVLEGLQIVKDRDGMPFSEQVRRALRAWLDSKGVKADRPRVAPRKRS